VSQRARNLKPTPERAAAISQHLGELWPDATVELDHTNAYQLLVATILAAQSTDKMINTVTPKLFAKYPDAAALSTASPAELEPMIFSTGFYRNKAKHLIAMAQAVVDRHAGVIPDTMDALVALPGVARKTANVVLGCALGKNEGIVVDTHVTRLAARMGFTKHTDPTKIEVDLMKLVPQPQWSAFAHRLIWHGRRVCHAKKPDCEHCVIAPLCPSAGLGAAIEQARADAKAKPKAKITAKSKPKTKPKPKAKAKPKARANRG
jgi:endonuclease-3